MIGAVPGDTGTEKEIHDPMSVTMVIDNANLQRDLTQLWKENHLTRNHNLGIMSCRKCSASDPHSHSLAYYVTKHDHQYKANKKLVAAIEDIRTRYEFDELHANLCQNPGCTCTDVVYSRIVGGVERAEIVDLASMTVN